MVFPLLFLGHRLQGHGFGGFQMARASAEVPEANPRAWPGPPPGSESCAAIRRLFSSDRPMALTKKPAPVVSPTVEPNLRNRISGTNEFYLEIWWTSSRWGFMSTTFHSQTSPGGIMVSPKWNRISGAESPLEPSLKF